MGAPRRRRIGSFKVPLVNTSPVEAAYKQLTTTAVTKPVRRTGGAHLSDMVALRKTIHVCSECMRYSQGLVNEHYRCDWGFKYIGNCDGCGGRWLNLTGFVHEEDFHKVLYSNHGRHNPNRRLYF